MRSLLTRKKVPCDMDAPARCPVEGPGGWYTREWMPGEKQAYKKAALMKPHETFGTLSS